MIALVSLVALRNAGLDLIHGWSGNKKRRPDSACTAHLVFHRTADYIRPERHTTSRPPAPGISSRIECTRTATSLD